MRLETKNPLHFDDMFAAKTMFKQTITHGMLTGGYVSALFAEHFPGAAFVKMQLNWLKPVRVGDAVTTTIIVTDRNPAKRRLVFDYTCTVQGTNVLIGTAELLLPQ